MKSLQDLKFSILELAPVRDDKSIEFSLRHALELAQHAEKLGYERFWLAEHHNMDGIASSATAVLLGFIAAHTQNIRLGSGGIMLEEDKKLKINSLKTLWRFCSILKHLKQTKESLLRLGKILTFQFGYWVLVCLVHNSQLN